MKYGSILSSGNGTIIEDIKAVIIQIQSQLHLYLYEIEILKSYIWNKCPKMSKIIDPLNSCSHYIFQKVSTHADGGPRSGYAHARPSAQAPCQHEQIFFTHMYGGGGILRSKFLPFQEILST